MIVAGLRAASIVLIPLVVALFLALISFPIVRWLERRRILPELAVTLTMLVLLAALIGPGLLIGAAVYQFARATPEYEARFRQLVDAASEWLRVRDIDITWAAGTVDPSQVFTVMVTALTGAVTLLSGSVLAVLIAAFMLLDAAVYVERRYHLLAADTNSQLARFTRELQIYLRVKTMVSLATGIAAGAWVAVLGVEFALLWGLIAFLFNYVPNLGSIVAALPPALLALLQFGPFTAALVLLGYLALNTVFGYVVEPYLMGRRLRLSPFVVLVSVIAWGWIWGVTGMLLSVPLTMAIKIALERSPDLQWVADLLAGGSDVAIEPDFRESAMAHRDERTE